MRKISALLPIMVFVAMRSFGQLTIDNATFFISSGATVTIQGNVTSNVNIQGTGVLRMNGSSLQNIDMDGAVIPNLEIDNTSNINLLSNATIGNTLLFTNGKTLLNNFDLQFMDTASISGASSSKFVITNGTGRLLKSSLGTTPFTFPIGSGDTKFNPLTLSNSGVVDDIGVRCVPKVLDQGMTGTPVTGNFVDNGWVITEGTTGGSDLSITAEWNSADELSGFNRLKSGIAKYNSGINWDLPASNVIAATGSGPYNRTRSGITSTGVFAVADLNRVNTAKLNLKIFLQGAYNSATGLMRDDLRTKGVIPTVQPYSSAMSSNFERVGIYDGTTSVNEHVPNASVFDVAGTNDDIVDWVYVSLNDATTPTTKLQTRAALLQRDGDIVEYDSASASFVPLRMPIDTDGNYNLAIGHRNHLGIRTSVTAFLQDNATSSYDFTTSQSQAYQNSSIVTNTAMAENNGVFILWAGDVNHDGYVRVTSSAIPPIPSDAAAILVMLGGIPNATGTTYSVGDLNMDGNTRVTSNGIPPIPSDVAFMLSTSLSGVPNATRREHK